MPDWKHGSCRAQDVTENARQLEGTRVFLQKHNPEGKSGLCGQWFKRHLIQMENFQKTIWITRSVSKVFWWLFFLREDSSSSHQAEGTCEALPCLRSALPGRLTEMGFRDFRESRRYFQCLLRSRASEASLQHTAFYMHWLEPRRTFSLCFHNNRFPLSWQKPQWPTSCH